MEPIKAPPPGKPYQTWAEDYHHSLANTAPKPLRPFFPLPDNPGVKPCEAPPERPQWGLVSFTMAGWIGLAIIAALAIAYGLRGPGQ
jgi:hypothetical protein